MLEPVNTYYIVVDGHGGSQGKYAIEISIPPPPTATAYSTVSM
jgi:hypothetical protein